MRDIGGKRKLIVTALAALAALAMVFSGLGMSIIPIGGSETTVRPATPGLRSGDVASVSSLANGNDLVSEQSERATNGQQVVANEEALAELPTGVSYNSLTGEAKDKLGNPVSLPHVPAAKPLSVEATPLPEEPTGDSPKPTGVGGIELGGPYTGFEGTEVLFEAVVTDPTLVLFRWDFDDDGVWDTYNPIRMDEWVTDTTFTQAYLDNYWGVVRVEGWDGVTMYSVADSGWGYGDPPPDTPYWLGVWEYYGTLGYEFEALKTVQVDNIRIKRLDYYWDPYMDGGLSYGRQAAIWDVDTQSLLGVCDPAVGFDWQQCTFPSTITLDEGKLYRASVTLGEDYYEPYFYYWYHYGLYTPSDTDVFEWGATYYAYSDWYPDAMYPVYYWYDGFIPAVEFDFSYSQWFPLVEDWDTADVRIENVAPIVHDLTVSPTVVKEGEIAEFSGMITDPGLDDTWTYHWCFGDGTCSADGQFKAGSGLSYMKNILVYDDEFPKSAIEALEYYGLPYEEVTNIYPDLGMKITSKLWDLIIIEEKYWTLTADTYLFDILTQVKSGAKLMYSSWGAYVYHGGAAAFWEYLGVSFVSDYTTPLRMYAWDPMHDVFNIVEQTPLIFNPTHNVWWRDGQKMNALSNAHAPMGYTPSQQKGQVALIIRNDFATIMNGFTPISYQGDEDVDGNSDMLELYVNELRVVGGPDVPKTMPWPVPPVKHAYRDDDPSTGTPQDDFLPILEVWDDDHDQLYGKKVDFLTDFETGTPWPTGWTEPLGGVCDGTAWQKGYGNLGTQSANWFYWYDYSGYQTNCLLSQKYDLSGVDPMAPFWYAKMSFQHYWYAYGWYDWSYLDGYVELSTDNGATWTVLKEFHRANPQYESKSYTIDISSAVGMSDVYLRFRVHGYYEYAWNVDNVRLEAASGVKMFGLGSAATFITVHNVEPVAYGAPMEGEVGEAIDFNFADYKIDDPTLWDPMAGGKWDPAKTESFMYRWNFDDGTSTPWYNKGSLELPKVKVLLIHTLSFGTGAAFISMLKDIDIVELTEIDFIEFQISDLPTVAEMEEYDIIMYASHYAYFGSAFEELRRAIGDRFAQYVDDNAGGVVTFLMTHDLGWAGDIWALKGRYIDEDYGPFEEANAPFGTANLGEVYQPEHRIMQGVTKLVSPDLYSGDYDLTPGAELIADWEDGNSAIGVKEHSNGARIVHIGAEVGYSPSVCGGDCKTLIRNAFLWTRGAEVPDNNIPTVSHIYGDNGIYDVDLQIIDDDMGWDVSGAEPVPIPGMTQTISHNIVKVEVMNRDPVIEKGSIEVYLAAKMCLRVSGKEWNTVNLDWYVDGVVSGGVSLTREPGDPNDQAKCDFTKVDLLGPHAFDAKITFVPFPGGGGSNPSWLIIEPWRSPTTPGHGTVVYYEDFVVGDPSTYVRDIDLGNLKSDLFDSGRGAPVDVEVTASDAGTDDLAFYYEFSDGTGAIINMHANDGGIVYQVNIDQPIDLAFDEPYFDRALNDMRTPYGTMDFVAHDNAYHRYTGGSPFVWVVIIVLDDDNSRGYDSPFDHDGSDMEFFVLDLT